MAKAKYQIIKLYKVNPFRKLNVPGSLKTAMKDLSPLAYYLYSLLLFADKEKFSPSYAYISRLLDITPNYAKLLFEELMLKGYVIMRRANNQVHLIVYYDNIDNLITGNYRKTDEFDKADHVRKYNSAYRRAVKSLEKKLENKRNGGSAANG